MAQSSRLRKTVSRRACVFCGCTDDNACMTETGPCYWVGPGLCSNPECLAKVTVHLTDANLQSFA
jgi:hypothetical protein